MGKFNDLTGQRFGRLVAIRNTGVNKYGKYLWLCQCDCGKTKEILSNSLCSWRTLSCGCLQVENRVKTATIHGLEYTYFSGIYRGIKKRCYNPNSKDYHRYGGRGIKMCDRWLADIRNFASDMGERLGDKMSIERIDNDDDYRPGNCRWATHKEQMNNTSRCHLVTIDGTTKTITQWSEYFGIPRSSMVYRIKRGDYNSSKI